MAAVVLPVLEMEPTAQQGNAWVEDSSQSLTLAQCRHFYSEEIRMVAGLTSPRLVSAFATVPRERFMGAPPWQFSSLGRVRDTGYRSTDDVRDLYHDVFVALKSSQFLNNGQPTMIARFLGALNLAPGKQVFHMGCGTGYYTAIIAEVVGPEGSVTAIEVDAELAALARENLRGYGNVTVIHGDGAAIEPEPADAVLINAGVTQPRAAWLDCLREGGTMVVPLCVGKLPDAKDAMVLTVRRHGNAFTAELLALMTIYSSASLRDPAMKIRLNESLESTTILGLRSVRTDAHDAVSSCIVHAPGFCLSGEPV